MSTSEPEVAIKEYGALYRRRWMILALGPILGLALGAGAAWWLPDVYTSTASVLVSPTEQDTELVNGRSPAEINLDTEAQIVTSSIVASRAAEALDTPETARELASHVTVSVPANTSVLKVAYTAESPTAAQRGADAFAEAYLANRRAIAEQGLQDRADELERVLSSLNDRLDEVSQKLAADPGPSERSMLTTERDLLVSQIRAGTEERAPLVNQVVDPGAVITEPQAPRTSDGFSSTVFLMSGLVAGLLLGAVLAVLRDHNDQRVRSKRDLERLGVQVLATQVDLPAPADVLSSGQPQDESLRQFRNALLARMIDHRGSVLVASVSPGEAGGTAAASLAATLAKSGLRTALICANTHYNVVEEAFQVPEEPGLADVLRSSVPARDSLHPVPKAPRLFVVPPGADGALFTELLQDASIRAVLGEFESLVDVVVLDVAPTSVNADAQTVVPATQGLLLVAHANQAEEHEIIEAVDQISHVHASLLGGIVVTVAKPAPIHHGAMAPVEPYVTASPAPDPPVREHPELHEREATDAAKASRWLSGRS